MKTLRQKLLLREVNSMQTRPERQDVRDFQLVVTCRGNIFETGCNEGIVHTIHTRFTRYKHSRTGTTNHLNPLVV